MIYVRLRLHVYYALFGEIRRRYSLRAACDLVLNVQFAFLFLNKRQYFLLISVLFVRNIVWFHICVTGLLHLLCGNFTDSVDINATAACKVYAYPFKVNVSFLGTKKGQVIA